MAGVLGRLPSRAIQVTSKGTLFGGNRVIQVSRVVFFKLFVIEPALFYNLPLSLSFFSQRTPANSVVYQRFLTSNASAAFKSASTGKKVVSGCEQNCDERIEKAKARANCKLCFVIPFYLCSYLPVWGRSAPVVSCF